MNSVSQSKCPILNLCFGCWNQYICERGQLVLWIAYNFVKRRSKYSGNSSQGVALPSTDCCILRVFSMPVVCIKPGCSQDRSPYPIRRCPTPNHVWARCDRAIKGNYPYTFANDATLGQRVANRYFPEVVLRQACGNSRQYNQSFILLSDFC